MQDWGDVHPFDTTEYSTGRNQLVSLPYNTWFNQRAFTEFMLILCRQASSVLLQTLVLHIRVSTIAPVCAREQQRCYTTQAGYTTTIDVCPDLVQGANRADQINQLQCKQTMKETRQLIDESLAPLRHLSPGAASFRVAILTGIIRETTANWCNS